MTLLVAGGGSGIGRATARLSPADQPVVVLDVDGEAANRVADELTTQGRVARGVAGDVTSGDDCAHAVSVAAALGDGLEQLAVCSGTIAGDDRLDRLTPERLRRIIDVNLVGPALLLQHALPVMDPQRRPAVVLVSSIGALRGRRRTAAYSASKAGLLGLARSVVADHAASGLRVNVVCPGPTATPMTHGLSVRPPSNATGTPATPADVAQCILWLLSEAAAWVNGVDLVVDQAETSTASGMFPATSRLPASSTPDPPREPLT